MSLNVLILAAGKGTRMHSKLPKVLQPLGGRPLLAHVIDTAHALQADKVIGVIGHGADAVKQVFSGVDVDWVLQLEQLGTGHAVSVAADQLDDKACVVILYGDVPLIAEATLRDLIAQVNETHPMALLTLTMQDSSGYGRIVRDRHFKVQAIVEEKDATPEQRQIREVNTGIMAVRGAQLKQWLSQLDNKNAQQEYYLTDIIAMCVADGFEVNTAQPVQAIEVLGVNDKLQLQALEREYQRLQASGLMRQGVTLADASRLDIRGKVTVGKDVFIDANVLLEGSNHLADDVTIGANCYLKNVTLGQGVSIQPFSHLEECIIAANCVIGPYARLRPGTELAEGVRIGNFVETKKSIIGKGSKVNHLSYIGDTLMGEQCNIGAGTITCNYDGVNKHLTEIGNRVFVGSDTQLVAPVKVNDDATIGAGSTITKEAPANELTLSRAKQLTIKGWHKPTKRD